MLRFASKNLRQKRSDGFTFSPLPETRRGKLLPLAFSLFFFIFCLLYANTVLAASVTLTWDAPTTNSDNTPLTDLSGYRVYMSTTSGQYNSGNIVKNNIPASSSTGGVTETTTVDNLPNGTYYFIVTAYDIYGNESGNSNEIQKTTTGGDTQAPTVPAGLSAQAISSSQINLSWTASTDNVGVTGYRIYRCLGSNCTPTTQIATSTTTSYSNTGLSASTAYTYTVSAYDAAGNVSSQSSSASATTSSSGDTQAPTVPAGFSAQAISSSQINLSWAASTDNVGVTGYRIYRCLGSNCTPTTQIATSTTTSYSNTGLSASTAYTYTVSAYDATGNVSSQSSSASATTASGSSGDTQAPTVPIGLSGQAFSISQINLSWTASTDNVGVTGYRIYRNGALIDTSATNSYSNTGLSASTTYSYTVSAYDAAGNVSSQSASASATTASSGGSGTQTATSSGDSEISGGGCGFVKDDPDKPNSDKNQFAMNIVMLFLSLFFIRMRRLWRLKWAALFMFGMFLLLPNIASAAVNLPWSTTYNCADWTQSNGLYNVNCDGLTGDGSWTTSDGKEEQITVAANYPGGSGGKGQRSWNGDGINNNSGGTHISFNSGYSEIWIRWYMRYETAYTWNPLNHDKILIVNVNQPGYVVVMFSWTDEIAVEVNGYRYGSGTGNGWNTVMANGSTDSNWNKTSDGQWHLYELHLIKDTNGSNGVAEWWIDRVKRLSRNDVSYGTFSGWSGILIASNQNNPSNGRTMYIDFDDIVVSTTGPIGGSIPDNLAPSPANGLW